MNITAPDRAPCDESITKYDNAKKFLAPACLGEALRRGSLVYTII